MNQNDNTEDHVQLLSDGTTTGEFFSDVEGDEHDKNGALNDITINERVVLNQCGCLLSRKRHLIKGNRKKIFFI